MEANKSNILEGLRAFHLGDYQIAANFFSQFKGDSDKIGRRVAHAVQVSEYYANKCENPNILIKNIDNLVSESETNKASVFIEEDTNDEDKQKQCEIEDYPHVKYNKAVLLFQLQHLQEAYDILNDLFRKIEPIDDLLAIKIAFLFLECTFLNEDAEKTRSVFKFLSSVRSSPYFLESAKEGDDAGAKSDSKQGDSDAQESFPTLMVNGYLNRSEKPLFINESEFSFLVNWYKSRFHIGQGDFGDAKEAIKLCGKKWDALSGVKGMTETLRSQGKAMIQMVKAKIAFCEEKYPKAVKVLNELQVVSQGHKTSVVSASCFLPKDEIGSSYTHPIYHLTNLGLIHIELEKPKLALFYFSKAFNCIPKTVAVAQGVHSTTNCITNYLSHRRAELSANTGLALIASDKPVEAFTYLKVAIGYFKENPWLWYRLAQCCIAKHQLDSTEKYNDQHRELYAATALDQRGGCVELFSAENTQDKKRIPTSHYSMRYQLPTTTRELLEDDEEHKLGGATDDESPDSLMTLELAAKCLRNTLNLMKTKFSYSVKLLKPTKSTFDIDDNSPIEIESARMDSLYQSTCLNLAYVCLSLNETAGCIKHCQKLLKIENVNDEYRSCAVMYLLESYCAEGRTADALTLIQENSHSFEMEARKTGIMDTNHQKINTDISMQVALYINVASVHLCNKNIPTALEVLKKAMATLGLNESSLTEKIPVPVLNLLIYIYLAQGKTTEALQLVKRRRLLSQSVQKYNLVFTH
eukprot:CAMPEP_0114992062 /NCGR_PEP_ID=MMETSP0216-20121206/11730_1 /TAXON_ID=223996 /ORGANISM="Protocruzia adherens, Strain Boccale" /LENGTH=750 /DNA_ID=CAMNT_0002355481 /DNA_START=25 /DNA_END=2277 /DNA_ORIENTATION=+